VQWADAQAEQVTDASIHRNYGHGRCILLWNVWYLLWPAHNIIHSSSHDTHNLLRHFRYQHGVHRKMTNTAERITQHIREQGCAQSCFTTTLQRFNLRQVRLFHVSAYHNIIQLPQLPHHQLQRSAAARSSKTFEVSFVAPSSLACAYPITSSNWIGRTAITEIPHEERLQLRACWCSNLSPVTSTLQTLNALGIRSRDSEQKKRRVVLAKQKHARQIPGFRAKDRKLFLPETHTDTDKHKRDPHNWASSENPKKITLGHNEVPHKAVWFLHGLCIRGFGRDDPVLSAREKGVRMKGASEPEQTSAKQRTRQQKTTTTTTLESLWVPLLVTALSNHRRQ